ncbi:MAG: YfhO family protein [Nitrospinota bacterium]
MARRRVALKRTRLQTLLICLLLGGLTLLYFRDTLIGDRVWADGPSIFSAYPWKTYSPYRDVEQRIELDNARYYLPHQLFLVRAFFDRGEFPLWNPFILAGTPFFASANKHTLAVTNLFYAFLDFPTAVNWAVAVQVFLSGLFMFIYLRALLGSDEGLPALAGAILFMFSGDLIERTFILSVEELMWVPLALWALHRASLPPFRLWPFACLGLLLSLIYLGGHEFNTPILYGLVGVVWMATLLRGWRGWSGGFRAAFFGGSGLALLVCVGLSGIKLFPSLENFLLSSRLLPGYPIDVDAVDATASALTKQLGYVGLNLAFPLRTPLILQSFGGNLFYFGFLALVCLAAAKGNARQWPAGLFVVLGLAGLIVGVGGRFAVTTLMEKFGELRWISLIRPFAQHHNQALLTTTSLPVAAAFCFRAVMGRAEDPLWRGRFAAAMAGLFGFLVLSGVAGFFGLTGVLSGFFRNFSVWMAAGVAGGTAILFGLWRRGLIGKKAVWVGMLGLMAVDLIVMVRLPFRLPDRRLWFPRTRSVEFLRRQPGPYRIVAFQDYQGPWAWFSPVFAPNTAMMDGIEDMRGWSNFMWRRHAQLFSGVENSNLASLDRLYRNRIDLYRNVAWFKWLDLFNVKYVLLSNDEEDLLRPDKFRLVHSSEVRIYENTDVLPRAFVVYDYEVEGDPARAIRRLSDKSFDYRSRVLLDEPLSPDLGVRRVTPEREEPFSSSVAEAGAPLSEVRFLEYRPNEVTLRVKSDRPGFLFLADSYHPGWRAFVDGNQVPVVPANFIFRGVPVPKGEHEVKFQFRPRSFLIGSGVTGGTLVLLWLVAVFSLYRRGAEHLPTGEKVSGRERKP